MSTFPEHLPSPPTGLLVIFSPGTIAWLGNALDLMYRAQRESAQVQSERLDAVLAALGPLTQTVERLLMATDDLSAQTSRAEAATSAALAAQANEIEQLRAAVEQLAQVPSTAAVAARIGAIADRLEQGNALLAADDAPASPTP